MLRENAIPGSLQARWRVALMVVVSLLVSASPAAASDIDDAETQFRLGNDAYALGHYREALAHWFASNRIAPNLHVVFNIARAYEGLELYDESYRYHQQVVAQAKTPEDLGPSRDAMARLAPRVALVDIATTPPGAAIFVDRLDLGSVGFAPATLAVAPGPHQIILTLPDHRDATVDVVAVRSKTALVRATLEPRTGRIATSGSPLGARVRVEHSDVEGRLGDTLVVPIGAHVVSVEQPGYNAVQRSVDVVEDGTTALAVTLEPEVGTLIVGSDEEGALVRVDGVPVGFAPAVLDRVPVGRRHVTVALAGFADFERDVEVVAGKSQQIDAVLDVASRVEAASLTPESVDEAPASVSIVTRPELDAFHSTTVKDALTGTRGVYSTDDQTYEVMGIRGFSQPSEANNRILIQIDGHTLNDDWLGAAYGGVDEIAGLDLVERVELVRGPGSTLYGTGALFGVVNLVTPEAVHEPRREVGVGIVAPGTARLSGTLAGRVGDFELEGYAGGVVKGRSDFYSPAQVGSDDAPDGVARGVGGREAGTLLLIGRNGALSARAYYNVNTIHIPNGSFETLYGDTREAITDRRAFAEVRYEPRLSDTVELSTRLSFDHYDYQGDFPYAEEDGGLYRETYQGNWLDLEGRVVGHTGPLRLTGGMSGQLHVTNIAEGGNVGDELVYDDRHPYQAFSIYALADWSIVDALALTAGLRFDIWNIEALPKADGSGQADRVFDSVNPRLALRFAPAPDQALKALFGRGFRAPSVYDLTYNDGGITRDPSPGLDPETIYTGELEYRWTLSRSWRSVVATYLTSIENLIQEKVAADAEEDAVITLENSRRTVWSFGAEAELRHEFDRGLFASLFYAFNHTAAGKLFGADELPNSPRHSAGAKLAVPLIGRQLGLVSRLVIESGRKDRDGARTGMAVWWDVGIQGRLAAVPIEYGVMARNALDWRVRAPVGSEMPDATIEQPRFWISADLTLRFD
ncbi:MAG: TonB-dependent receptor [Myxococcota bacterium]